MSWKKKQRHITSPSHLILHFHGTPYSEIQFDAGLNLRTLNSSKINICHIIIGQDKDNNLYLEGPKYIFKFLYRGRMIISKCFTWANIVNLKKHIIFYFSKSQGGHGPRWPQLSSQVILICSWNLKMSLNGIEKNYHCFHNNLQEKGMWWCNIWMLMKNQRDPPENVELTKEHSATGKKEKTGIIV